MARKKQSFEEAMNRLEEIVTILEQEEIDLEKSVRLYREGMELSLFCQEKLESAQKEVTLLKEKADGIFEETVFEVQEEKTDGL